MQFGIESLQCRVLENVTESKRKGTTYDNNLKRKNIFVIYVSCQDNYFVRFKY